MRNLLLILFLFIGSLSYGQTVFTQTYVDRCTGNVQVVTANFVNGSATVAFYNKVRTFTYQEFVSGELQQWLNETYAWWESLSACSTTTSQAQNAQNTATNATNAANTASNATSTATNATNTATSGTTQTTTTNTSGGTTQTNTNNTGDTSNATSSQTNTTDTSSSNDTSSSSSTETSNTDTSSSSESSQGETGDTSSGGESSESSGGGESSESESGKTEDTSEGSGETESSEESKTEETKEESKEEEVKEESKEEESKEEESKEEESKEEESEEESSEEESEEESDEESEEESEEEDEEESEDEETEEESEDEEEENEKKFMPIQLRADMMANQALLGNYDIVTSIGATQSSIYGDESYGATAMIWSNLRQFSLNTSYTKVHMQNFNVSSLNHDTHQHFAKGSSVNSSDPQEPPVPRVTHITSASVGYMNNFGNGTFVANMMKIKPTKYGTFGAGLNVANMYGENRYQLTMIGYNILYTNQVMLSSRINYAPAFIWTQTPYMGKPSWHRKLMPWGLDMRNQLAGKKVHGMMILANSFTVQLTRRFSFNMGATFIKSTDPNIPLIKSFMIGAKLPF